MTIILGAGLAGLSVSYHIGHKNCILFEKNNYPTGHIHSELIDGFTWDEGPHVSFTEYEYVKKLFNDSVDGELLEYPISTVNYFKGNWIPHPAQSNLFAIPDPLRKKCLEDFLYARNNYPVDYSPRDYQEWLDFAFGKTFSTYFPTVYTKKYWTVGPEKLTTNWVGKRVFIPNIDQVRDGFSAPLKEQTHYIKKIRYPLNGGYMSFANKLIKGSNIKLEHELSFIDFETKEISFTNGYQTNFKRLVSTIPLPTLILKSNAPLKIKEAANNLNCSSALIINITADHKTVRNENWIYVYDEDKYSTRINCTELLSSNNAPNGKTGVQVEVYFSNYKPKQISDNEIVLKVIEEILEMGLVIDRSLIKGFHTKWINWANVIFDKQREENLNLILEWLALYGLVREDDDLEPMTDWDLNKNQKLGNIVLAGRFGQWKYFWTDDCVLRGLLISKDYISY